jgi:nitrogen fixation NifU-like protein
MELNNIYTELIMEHNASTHNRRRLNRVDRTEKGHNPSCGDEIAIELKIDGDFISEAAFTGSGCAISQASTSIMIDLITGKTLEEAHNLAQTFISMIKREITDEHELEVLEDAIALKNISNMPARVKCAVLAWHALEECIKK